MTAVHDWLVLHCAYGVAAFFLFWLVAVNFQAAAGVGRWLARYAKRYSNWLSR